MKKLLTDILISFVAYLLTILLLPFLYLVYLNWREHERRVLCDAGNPGA